MHIYRVVNVFPFILLNINIEKSFKYGFIFVHMLIYCSVFSLNNTKFPLELLLK
jgi:hypothetical protein